MIRWRQVVQSYPCEGCGAPPGSPCITVSGQKKFEPHYLRAQVARANQWRDPEEQPHSTNPPHMGHSHT